MAARARRARPGELRLEVDVARPGDAGAEVLLEAVAAPVGVKVEDGTVIGCGVVSGTIQQIYGAQVQIVGQTCQARAEAAEELELGALSQWLLDSVQEVAAKAKDAWGSMSTDVPKMVDAIQSRVDILSKSHHLPHGVTKDSLAAAKSGLVERWASASACRAAFVLSMSCLNFAPESSSVVR